MMELLAWVRKEIGESIAEQSRSVTEVSTQLNYSSSVSGIGQVTKIVETATQKYIEVTLTNRKKIRAYPGPTPVILYQAVTVSGGRVFG